MHSVSHHTLAQSTSKKKFVYRPEPQDGEEQVLYDEDSGSSSNDSIGDDENLEDHLLSFDKDEADIIRNINKGSLKIHSSTGFLNKTTSLSPLGSNRKNTAQPDFNAQRMY